MVNFQNEVLVSDLLTEMPLLTTIQSDYIVIYVIEQGAIRFRIDDREHVGTQGYIILLPEQKMVVTELTPDFRMRYMQMSVGFVIRLQTEDSFRILQQVLLTPFIPLQERVFAAFRGSIDSIYACIQFAENPNREKMIHHICKAYFYGIGYLTFPRTDEQEYSSREQEITERFVELLRFQFREHHDVSYYADMLHISPKYLSACVKQTTHFNAKHHIDEQLLNYAMTLLKQTKRSVSEIAYELQFPDQSAFGKFFRTHTGIGPKEWRAQFGA